MMVFKDTDAIPQLVWSGDKLLECRRFLNHYTLRRLEEEE